MRRSAKTGLQTIPGVGPSIEQDLLSIGIHRVCELKGRDPEELYAALEHVAGKPLDRCLLYVRCAVYFAGHPQPEAEKLKWWNWQDNPKIRSKNHEKSPF